jgi:hypothetical protein
MDDILTRIATNLIARTEGPLHFRMFLQPVMAIGFAIHDGLKDAKAGKSPYFWSLVTVPEHRKEMMRDGWKSVGKVFILALVLDVIYQWIVQKFVYPGEAIIVSILLAIVPYLLVRGVVTRIARKAPAPHLAPKL